MRVVVTGGAGFIGAHVCRYLAAQPYAEKVIALDDLSTGSAANLLDSGVALVEGSILDRPLLRELIAEADAVIHLAARPSVPRSLADPAATHEINATGTLNVLEACRARAGHLVVASSSSVYGSAAELPKHEELAARPMSPYAASKLATEAYALAYGAAFGLPVQVFRFFNVYGPLQPADHAYAAVVPAFVSAALRDRPLTIYGDGTQTRDFTYVGTVAQVLAETVANAVTSSTPVNLAFGSRVSLLDLVERLSLILERPLAVEHRPARAGDVHDSQASNDRLLRLFPAVRPVELGDGLRATVHWLSRIESASSGRPIR